MGPKHVGRALRCEDESYEAFTYAARPTLRHTWTVADTICRTVELGVIITNAAISVTTTYIDCRPVACLNCATRARGPARSSSWARCRATPWARCRRSCSAAESPATAWPRPRPAAIAAGRGRLRCRSRCRGCAFPANSGGTRCAANGCGNRSPNSVGRLPTVSRGDPRTLTGFDWACKEAGRQGLLRVWCGLEALLRSRRPRAGDSRWTVWCLRMLCLATGCQVVCATVIVSSARSRVVSAGGRP